ncbi:MAG: Crp/Fnr family transcriptional regulator [Burkholderiaceae bacterium]
MELSLGDVLCETGAVTKHVYFPISGYISLVAGKVATARLEVGLVGSEGMLGVQLLLDMPAAPLHALVQGSGTAWRLSATSFTRELARCAELQQCLHRYTYVLMAQLASAAPCLRYHEIGPRLARWLLMTQDRASTPTFPVTHQFLAYMLGVRRAGVTVAASRMQASGLIAYHRGLVTVLDRAGLEAASCTCYAEDMASYALALTRRVRSGRARFGQR